MVMAVQQPPVERTAIHKEIEKTYLIKYDWNHLIVPHIGTQYRRDK